MHSPDYFVAVFTGPDSAAPGRCSYYYIRESFLRQKEPPRLCIAELAAEVCYGNGDKDSSASMTKKWAWTTIHVICLQY
jgi:hypothetical protein